MSLGLSWNLEAPALAVNSEVMGEQRWGLGVSEKGLGGGSLGSVDHEGMLRSPLLFWKRLELPAGGRRKPRCHLPCPPGGPFSWPLWAQLLRDGHSCPAAPTWREARGQGDQAVQVVIMLILKRLLV